VPCMQVITTAPHLPSPQAAFQRALSADVLRKSESADVLRKMRVPSPQVPSSGAPAQQAPSSSIDNEGGADDGLSVRDTLWRLR
jgi:hypothetical protein